MITLYHTINLHKLQSHFCDSLFTSVTVHTLWECTVTASGPFKVAKGEGPDARLNHFIGSDAVQRRAQHGVNSNSHLSSI